MEYIALQLFNGLVNGSFYALLSLGLAVIFGVLRVVNFAHGALYMLGAFAAYLLLQDFGVGFWVALVLAPIAIGIAGMVLERLLIRRLYGLDPLYNFLLTFGLTLMIQDGVRLRYGLQGQPYPAPAELAGSVSAGLVAYPTYRLFVIAFSIVVCIVVWYVIERTRLGMIVRAATERPELRLGLRRAMCPVLALGILLWGPFAMSVDLLLGYVGLLSSGPAAFWGLGAYAAAIAATSTGVPFAIAALVGAAASALLAVPFGYLAIRRRGIYFAMVTLAFAQLVFYVANEWRDVTGGENGLHGVPRTFPGLALGRSADFYYAALPLILLGYALAYRIVHSPFGHVLVAIRDNEPRAQALGYATWRYKLLAFVLSGGLAGLAGGLFALGNGFASLDLLHWTTSGQAVLITILGGIGTLWGSLLGAVIVLELRDALTSAPEASGVVTGAVFVVIVLAFRRGLWARGQGALRRFAAPLVSARIDISEGEVRHGRS